MKSSHHDQQEDVLTNLCNTTGCKHGRNGCKDCPPMRDCCSSTSEGGRILQAASGRSQESRTSEVPYQVCTSSRRSVALFNALPYIQIFVESYDESTKTTKDLLHVSPNWRICEKSSSSPTIELPAMCRNHVLG